jgi:Domain of unknown function (DUF4185)
LTERKILGPHWRAGVISLLFFLWIQSGLARAETSGPCTPTFSFHDGWLGADAAYSIPLPGGRSVWIFGDTLIGDKRVVEGNEPRMVRNSIGISRCDQEKWQLQYVIRQSQEGQPQDFFKAQTKDTWYWALDGFVHGNNLWVTLLCVRNARVKRPDGFDFETCGADLARVSDLDADPQKWKVSYFPLVPDGVAAYPSASAVVHGDHVYLFALYEKGSRPQLVTRIPLAGLDGPAAHLQYLSRTGKWESGFKPDDAMPVMQAGATEMTVRYHPDIKKWLAVMKSPDMSSDAILLRTAPEITGPWSPDEVIYHIPEMKKDSPGYDKNTFCYAGKEHPEFKEPGPRESETLLITYVCNTMKVPDLVTHPNIYVPKVLRLPLPADKAGEASQSTKYP